MSKNKKESKKGFSTLNRVLVIQLIIMLGLSLFITTAVSKKTKQNSKDHMHAITDERVHLIENYVRDAEKTLTAYSKAAQITDLLKNPEDPELRKAAQAYTESYSADIENLEGIYASKWTTEVLTHTNEGVIGLITRKDAEPLKQLQDAMLNAGDGVYNTGIIISPASGEQCVSMYKAVYDETGEPIGLVGLGIFTRGLIETLDRIPIPGIEESFYSMVNVNNNQYVFNVDRDKIYTEPTNADLLKVVESMKGETEEKSGDFEYKLDGKKYVSIYTYMPEHGWLLTIDDTKSEVYELTRYMRIYLGIFGLTILALIIVFNMISKRQEKINQKLVSTIAKSNATKKSLNTAMFKDVLTEASNRISFSMDVEKAAKSGQPYYFMMFNICQFSEINTQYGSDAGDRMLVRTVESLREIFPDNEIYRTGSDEFIVAVPVENGKPITEEIVDRTNTALRQLLVPEKIGEDTSIYPKYKVAILRKNANIDSSVVTVLKDMTNKTGEAIYGMIDFMELNR